MSYGLVGIFNLFRLKLCPLSTVRCYLSVSLHSFTHINTFTAARTSSLILNMEPVLFFRNVGIYHPDYSSLQVRRTMATVKNCQAHTCLCSIIEDLFQVFRVYLHLLLSSQVTSKVSLTTLNHTFFQISS
jgi:hypothetical protein